ncbi:LysR family transcriptional regulator [Rhizobium sp. AG855]|uniref:LysR family transcriptional regulator n=1 Tax=Rhizobium sp. AG855 TaxID=2183898 RepID=UPI000E7093A4|nr:LysR family transcriptional regulator [Rhizobium sp. AG855]RKE79325.1 DNA-binding transcriptional LysR family regulator [Rhizobium sp. AG855]
MDLRQLRYFVAVAKERNFTRAADLLHMAQPPLSRQIQLLEEELGVDLIIRSSRPVRLTEAGRVFNEQALQILGRVEQMKEATRRVGLNQNSVLSIGFVASTLYGGLPALVRKLRQQAPDVDIQLLEMMSVHQVSALKEGRIDIGFGRLRHTDPQIVTTILREEPLAVAIARDTRLAFTSDPILPEALVGEKLILYPRTPRPSFADHVLNVLLEKDVRPAEIQEVTEIQTALGLVAAEAGVCVVPASARKLRSDVHYRLLAGERSTSPVVLSQRVSDNSAHVTLVRRLALEMQMDDASSLDLWSDVPS